MFVFLVYYATVLQLTCIVKVHIHVSSFQCNLEDNLILPNLKRINFWAYIRLSHLASTTTSGFTAASSDFNSVVTCNKLRFNVIQAHDLPPSRKLQSESPENTLLSQMHHFKQASPFKHTHYHTGCLNLFQCLFRSILLGRLGKL